MNKSFLAGLFAFSIPALCFAAFAGEWLFGEQEILTIESVVLNGPALHGPEIRIKDPRMQNSIFVIGSIRRARASGGTSKASASDLRPGTRIRAHGGHGSSPFGSMCDRLIIVK